MIPAPIKANENERLAAQLCGAPIARISLVDTDRE